MKQQEETVMIAFRDGFEDKWELLQKKIGEVLSTAYHGTPVDCRDAINAAQLALDDLKTLTKNDPRYDKDIWNQ